MNIIDKERLDFLEKLIQSGDYKMENYYEAVELRKRLKNKTKNKSYSPFDDTMEYHQSFGN